MTKLPKTLTTVTPLSKYLAMVLFIVLPFVGFYLGVAYQKLVNPVSDANHLTNSPSKTVNLQVTFPQGSSETFQQIFYKVEKERANLIDSPQVTKDDVWWITTDGWSILVPSNYSFEAKLRPIKESMPDEVEFARINSIVKEELTSAGYTLNTMNSSKSISDKKYYDYVQAYEKGEEKCVATSSPDVGHLSDETKFYSSFTFSCFNSSELQQAYDKQVQFLKALNEKDAVVSNIKINGDRAIMGLNWRRSGATAFMYKTSGVWKKAYVGQAAPECNELQKTSVPKEFWVDCYDSSNNIVKGSFNFNN